jgi:hypothetical protein
VTTAYRPMSMAELAGRLPRDNGKPFPWRWIREFLVEFEHENSSTQATLLVKPPPPTGSRPFDAFLAALAEHLAFHHALPCPRWTQEPERSLDSAWFVTELPAARAAAMETSPASFRRRLIFIDRDDLATA